MTSQVQPKRRYASDLLEDQVVLVTGAGSGLGKETAIEMALCGAKIAIYGRTLKKLEDTAREIEAYGGEVLAVQGDTREPEQIQNVYDVIKKQWGKLDTLVNNAGGQYISPAKDISLKGFDAVIRNNLNATWYMTKLAADNFFFDQGGKVICVTALTRAPLSGYSHTVAARGGVSALMRTLAFEWSEFGIKLNCVAPGTILSFPKEHYPIEMKSWLEADRNLVGRNGTPADISGAIIFLASCLGDFMTGEELYIDGGESFNVKQDATKMISADLKKKQGR